jgi:TonB family protein
MPKESCTGALGVLPEAARDAGAEGVVILRFVVGEDGRPRDIKVVKRQPYGMTEAAVAAMRKCEFTPGEREGKRVPVQVLEFKIRFRLGEAD